MVVRGKITREKLENIYDTVNRIINNQNCYYNKEEIEKKKNDENCIFLKKEN